MTHFICLDIDHKHGAMRWAEEHLPPPRWTSQNPSNGHAHIVYELKTSVCTSEHGSRKALDYLAKIQAGLVRETRADLGYTNCITKNPMHSKSIAKFCWKRDAYHYNEFICRQALKGSEGSKVSRRRATSDSARTQRPWGDLGMSQSTYYRHKKSGKI